MIHICTTGYVVSPHARKGNVQTTEMFRSLYNTAPCLFIYYLRHENSRYCDIYILNLEERFVEHAG